MDGDINDEEAQEPNVGTIFCSISDAKECYRRYGNENGFSIKNRTSKRNDDGECIYVIFSCNHACKPNPSTNPYHKRPSKKTDCKAKLIIAICPDGKWTVTIFTKGHNHVLSVGDSHSRKLSGKKVVDKNLKWDDNMTRLRIGQGDSSVFLSFFMKMQADDLNFFYMLDFDDEGCLRNVFWADSRSRAAYEEFSDVVMFETSYLANGYDTPVTPFLGVNHHGQTILLGCGLLSSDDIETFAWLFQCWLACMSSCAPRTIITDRGKNIQKAVETVFPNTRHIWCLWHIVKQLSGKLRSNKQSDSIKLAFQNIIYDSLTYDEFEVCWNRMIEKYDLQGNEWFISLYCERHRWVPIFLKDAFSAGISTTKRTESVNMFFDGYVNSKTTIKQFVERYENTLRKKVQKEKQEDINSANSVDPCITHYAMEKQFQDAYTAAKFKEFQHELRGKMYCEMSTVKTDVLCSGYEVVEDLKIGEVNQTQTFQVSLTHDDCGVYCSCCLFESRGILCRHAIVVLIHNKILRVPDKYIIHRWRKNIKRRHTKVRSSYDDSGGKHEGLLYEKMCSNFNEVAYLAIDFEDKSQMVMDWINEMKKELRRDEGMWRVQPANIMNHDRAASDQEAIRISPSFKSNQSKVDIVRKEAGKLKKTGSKTKTNTSGNNIQEVQMREEDGVVYAGGALYMTQESIGFPDSGIASHGMHLYGSHDALPTLNLADANLTLYGVPQSGQPNMSCSSVFVPGRG